MQFHWEKQTNKKATRACLKVYLKTREKYMELKNLDQLRKKTSLFLIAKPLVESLAHR